MTGKLLLRGDKCRQDVFAGVQELHAMVAATMGPKGRNVIIEKPNRPPQVTKDGVTVANEIELEEPMANMGAQLVKQAARKTNDAAGDGTTTATVLAHAIMAEGLTQLKEGRNAIAIQRGIDAAVEGVCESLERMKRNVDNKKEYKAIATISAQDERVGEMIANMIEKVGQDGVVTVEPGNGFGLEEEHVQGVQFDNGYRSPYFVTDPNKMECVMTDVPILLTDQRIDTIDSILPLLDALGKSGCKAILIIAEDVDGEALATLVMNKMRGNFFGVPVKAPSYGRKRIDFLHDLAAVTGATVISEELGRNLIGAKIEDLGRAKRVTISKFMTTLSGGRGSQEAIAARIGEIKNEFLVADKPGEKERLQARIAKLSGGIGIIKVGAATDAEQKELQHRVEDALSATKAAVEEGIVPGGGIAYIRAMQDCHVETLAALKSDDEKLGATIIFNSLSVCFKTILRNAGHDADAIYEKVREAKGSAGFNAATGEYCDMYKEQIINPKKVERCALQYAASVAGMFLTLEGAIADKPVSVTPEQLMAAVKGE